MSYKEAKEDGIMIEESRSMTTPTFYYPLCAECGAEVIRTHYKREIKYLCPRCKRYNDAIKRLEQKIKGL